MKKYVTFLMIILGCIGIIDSTYLTIEHFSNTIPPCSIHAIFADCGRVLQSKYSVMFGVPLALIGVFFYSTITLGAITSLFLKKSFIKSLLVLVSTAGFLGSVYFVYLQLFVIHAICFYCMVSAVTSTTIFILTQLTFGHERKWLILALVGTVYKYLLKPIFFRIDAEVVHVNMIQVGQLLGSNWFTRFLTASLFEFKNRQLHQQLAGLTFENPIGLAAGFDYEARLTQILPAVGFGFESVGTITNLPYEGNPRPMLGRLPHSKSLMVNKGFKNLGAKKTSQSLSGLKFSIPIGISVGRTNSQDLATQQKSIQDIVKTFRIFEKSAVKNAYYELNISCPNLVGDVTFYPAKNLDELLIEVDKLKLTKPLFVKMPIEKSDEDVLKMLKVIAAHSPVGVIFGNLQKDRKNPQLKVDEVKKFNVGNFSGKPTFNRSNELIKLTYQNFKDRLIIIGCGGVFNAEDAYRKITLGASLVQLITGMVFEGPQLISQINMGLVSLLERDGFKHISQVVGSKNRTK